MTGHDGLAGTTFRHRAHYLRCGDDPISTTPDPVKKTRILIVDDHPIVRLGLRQILTDQPDLTICGEAESVATGLTLYESESPDLTIVDVSLKGESGLALATQIRDRRGDAKILIVSVHSESFYAEQSLIAGASGYLDKQEGPELVVAAVRAVMNGEIFLSVEMSNRILKRGIQSGLAHSPKEWLTTRECQVFNLIGEGMTTKEVASALHVTVKTVETHREGIKKKLGLLNSNELIHYCLRWAAEQKLR